MFVCGYHAKGKLDSVRAHLSTDEMVRHAFEEADVSKDGSLSAEELGQLCVGLGSTLEPQELEAALQTLDKDGSGKIEMEEFMQWWKGGSDAHAFIY